MHRLMKCPSQAVLMLALAMLVTREASATSSRVPVPVARRALTLPNATFRLDDGPYWPLPSGLAETTFFDTPDGLETRTQLNLGIGFGISDDFELGAHLVRFEIDPERDLSDPSVYVMYRFLDGDFELGIFAEGSVPFERDPLITAGMPLALHFGDSVRLDTGPFIEHDFEREDDPDFLAPFQLPITIAQKVTIGPEAAIVLRDFEHDDFLVGFFAGYTLTSGGQTLGDIGGRFRVPSTDIGIDLFQVMLELDFFFDL